MLSSVGVDGRSTTSDKNVKSREAEGPLGLARPLSGLIFGFKWELKWNIVFDSGIWTVVVTFNSILDSDSTSNFESLRNFRLNIGLVPASILSILSPLFNNQISVSITYYVIEFTRN